MNLVDVSASHTVEIVNTSLYLKTVLNTVEFLTISPYSIDSAIGAKKVPVTLFPMFSINPVNDYVIVMAVLVCYQGLAHRLGEESMPGRVGIPEPLHHIRFSFTSSYGNAVRSSHHESLILLLWQGLDRINYCMFCLEAVHHWACSPSWLIDLFWSCHS